MLPNRAPFAPLCPGPWAEASGGDIWAKIKAQGCGLAFILVKISRGEARLRRGAAPLSDAVSGD
jgi:hypothetical protein